MRPLLLSLSALLLTQAASAAELAKQKSVRFEDQSQWAALPGGRYVTVSAGRIEFTSAEDAIIRTIELEGREVIVTPVGGSSVGVLIYADGHPHALEVTKFQIYDAEGTQTAALSDPGFSSVILAPSGTGFVGISGAEGLRESVLQFFDGAGRPLDSLRVSFFEGGSFSRNGSHFLFETAVEGLQVATAVGKVVRQFGKSSRWTTSADTRLVVVADERSATLYRDGISMASLDWPDSLGSVRQLAASPDGRYFGMWSSSHFSLYRADSAILLWSKPVGDTVWNYRSCDIARDGGRIVLGLDYDPGKAAPDRHLKSRCIVLGIDGSELGRADAAPVEWSGLHPIVRFEEDSRSIQFLDRDQAHWLIIE